MDALYGKSVALCGISASCPFLCYPGSNRIGHIQTQVHKHTPNVTPLAWQRLHFCEMPLVFVHQTAKGWPFINLPVPHADFPLITVRVYLCAGMPVELLMFILSRSV